MPATELIRMTRDQWIAEATNRYGSLTRFWKFVCPACGHAQSGGDFRALGLEPEEIGSRLGFSCIGRSMPTCSEAFSKEPGPCNYAGGGLIRIAPIAVVIGDEEIYVFDFADDPLAPKG